MRRRRKLKPIELDPEREAWHTSELQKQVDKAKRIMKTFDTLHPLERRALTIEPCGSVNVEDTKGLSKKIDNGEFPPNIDHEHLATHIISCGTEVYRKLMKEHLDDITARPVALFRKRPPSD